VRWLEERGYLARRGGLGSMARGVLTFFFAVVSGVLPPALKRVIPYSA